MNTFIAIVVALGLLWGAGIFFGVISGVSKPFKTQTPISTNRSQMEQRQREAIEETDKKRERLMEDIKQKMQDQSHRY